MWTGTHYGISVRAFIAVNVVTAVVWLAIAALAGREYARRRQAPGATAPAGTRGAATA